MQKKQDLRFWWNGESSAWELKTGTGLQGRNTSWAGLVVHAYYLSTRGAMAKGSWVWEQLGLHGELEVSLRPSTEMREENKKMEKEKEEEEGEEEEEKEEEITKVLMIFSY